MALLDESANGVFIIGATPFSDNGALDLKSVDRMVDFYLERGANGLTILGVMGEAPKLTEEESRAFIGRAIARAGKAPIIVGVSAPGLASIRTLAASAMDVGRRASWSLRPAICAPTTRSSTISSASRKRWAQRPSPCRITRSPPRC